MKGQKAQTGTLQKVLRYIRPYWAAGGGCPVLLAAVTVAAEPVHPHSDGQRH